ncbi:hypothetical protein K431DRAFT_285819 [Polychaeton citri CBS 116435]|uniref:WW-domain-binding protein n=1 Tax=Polychaeton citri CBS 116435 TaxID=1314669 RepID=A0A9P4Q8F0_9PEZI|nr:hypothetical protein K431DRAFT_285819 [Polychaeton citri CBS 116435]
MSVNWVMLSPQTNPPYTPLPQEQHLWTSPPRVAFSLTVPAHFPGKKQQPFSLASSTGVLYLTTRRVLYVPDKSTHELQSFATPILNLHDSHVTAPFFGPNAWITLCQPTAGGGIPTPSGGVVELKLTFKDGGAYDFQSKYEQIRERLQQALEVSRMDGDGSTSSRNALNGGLNTGNVNLDELPAYQEENDGPLINPAVPPQEAPQPVVSPIAQQQPQYQFDERPAPRATDNAFSPPAEPPPGYEEAQMSGLQNEVERRFQRD